MTSLAKNIRSALLVTLGLTLIVSVLYPLLVLGIGQLLFHDKANGSLISRNGKVIGSELIGQNFQSPSYFHPRPSAAGKGYDASSSSGSNLGPISSKLLNGLADDPATKDIDESFAGLKQRVDAYRSENGIGPEVRIPSDAVTASASGLDPHISPRNAELQVARVAKAREWSEEKVKALVKEFTEGPALGILGEPTVNVFKLNLALDKSKP